jgi:hypothetical protein
MTDVAALLRRAGTSQYALDSSKLRGGAAVRQAREVGLVKIEKYHQAVAYLLSPELVEELADAAEGRDRLAVDLPIAGRLLSLAIKLGIAPERAVTVLLTAPGTRAGQLNVEALADLVSNAADDLDAAAVAAQRLAEPDGDIITLEQLAEGLGFDLEEIRGEVERGEARGQFAT